MSILTEQHLVFTRRNTYRYLVFLGDCYGCDSELGLMLTAMEAGSYGGVPLRVGENSTLMFLGDLIHKGTQSFEVLERVHALATSREDGDCFHALCILGNHEVEALRCFRRQGKYADAKSREKWLAKEGGRREVQEKLNVNPQLVHWLESLPYFVTVMDANITAVHAGVVPGDITELGIQTLSGPTTEKSENPKHPAFGQHPYQLVELREVWQHVETGLCRPATKEEVEERAKCEEDLDQKKSAHASLNREIMRPWGEVFNGEVDLKLSFAGCACDGGSFQQQFSKHTLVFGHYSKLLFQRHNFAIGLDTKCWGGGFYRQWWWISTIQNLEITILSRCHLYYNLC